MESQILDKRPLTEQDFTRMNLPKEFWTSKIDQVQSGHRQKVVNFLNRLPSALNNGVGLIISGPQFIGKTSISALIMKEVRSIGKTAYFTSLWELRDNIKERADFDDSQSVMARAKGVDLLVLDNLRIEDVKEKMFLNIREIEELLAYRRARSYITVVTTRLGKSDLLTNELKGIMDGLAGSIALYISGKDMRAIKSIELEREFLGVK